MAGQLTLIVVVVVFKTFDDSLCRIILRRITIGFEVGYIGIEDGISMLLGVSGKEEMRAWLFNHFRR